MSHTILVVDDNRTNRQLAKDALEFHGHHVLEADSGPEALRVAQREHPDLIVLDIQLPRMSGLDVLQQLRQSPDPALARVKVIAATALAMASDRERCLAAGADDYLARPFRFRDLLERIGLLLRA